MKIYHIFNYFLARGTHEKCQNNSIVMRIINKVYTCKFSILPWIFPPLKMINNVHPFLHGIISYVFCYKIWMLTCPFATIKRRRRRRRQWGRIAQLGNGNLYSDRHCPTRGRRQWGRIKGSPPRTRHTCPASIKDKRNKLGWWRPQPSDQSLVAMRPESMLPLPHVSLSCRWPSLP